MWWAAGKFSLEYNYFTYRKKTWAQTEDKTQKTKILKQARTSKQITISRQIRTPQSFKMKQNQKRRIHNIVLAKIFLFSKTTRNNQYDQRLLQRCNIEELEMQTSNGSHSIQDKDKTEENILQKHNNVDFSWFIWDKTSRHKGFMKIGNKRRKNFKNYRNWWHSKRTKNWENYWN